MKYPAYLGTMLVVAAQLSAVPHAAAGSAAVTLYSDITSSCTISQPEVVTLPNIPALAFAGKDPGSILMDYWAELNITVSCPGATRYSLTFTPGGATPTKTQCMATDKAFIRFCVLDFLTVLDFSKGPVVLSKPVISTSTAYHVLPAVGTGDITAGTVNGIMTVVVAPL
ncbi:hypothetical protein [Erwinia tasmaniensis]|nr:hypothetical protein [Erwinia tasmaniensis]